MNRQSRKRYDRSLFFLFLANLITIVQAVWQEWNLTSVMWIYLGQSLSIGFYNWLRLRCLKRFSTGGILVNGKPVGPNAKTQRWFSSFFALHFGFFHLVYIFFLLMSPSQPKWPEIRWIIVFAVIFFINHGFSFRTHVKADLKVRRNIGALMLFPYARIVPMHITLVVGANMWKESYFSLVLFLSLKTLADLIMHSIEHRGPQDK